MWNPGCLIIKNLLTHKETSYTFLPDKAVMFSGINLDDTGVGSNGSGKSTIGEGACLALSGESLRKVRSVELVRNGEKFLEVEFSLHNSQTKDELWIYRKIWSNTNTNLLKIKFNGKLPDEVPEASSGEGCVDIRKGTEFIFQCLGISEEDLFNYYILSKDTYQPFLLSTDSVMKKVIDRFSNAKLVDPVFTLIKTDIAEIDKKVSDFEREQVKYQTKIEQYQEELEDIKDTDQETLRTQLVEQYEGEISEIKEQVKKYSKEKEVLEESKNQAEEKKLEVEKEVTVVEKQKLKIEEKGQERIKVIESKKLEIQKVIEGFEEKIEKVQKIIEKKETQLEELIEIKNDIYKKVSGAIQCPECSHEFSLAEKGYNIKEGKELLIELGKDIEGVEKSIQLQKEKIKEIKSESSKSEEELRAKSKEIRSEQEKIELEVKDFKNKLTKLKDQISQNESTVITKNREVINLSKSITSSSERIILLEKKIKEEKDREIIDRSEEVEKKIAENELLIKEVTKKIEEQGVLKQEKLEQEIRFKKFKTFLANQCINSIEGYTNFYLKRFRTNLQVKVEGNRELASGKTKEEISCTVLRDGFEEGNLKKFSGGEKFKIILGNILALQKIINYNSESGGLNFTWLDEIVESIDYVGIMAVYEAANQLNQSINIISHVKDTGFENEVFIKKEGKVSEIIDKQEYLKLLLIN